LKKESKGSFGRMQMARGGKKTSSTGPRDKGKGVTAGCPGCKTCILHRGSSKKDAKKEAKLPKETDAYNGKGRRKGGHRGQKGEKTRVSCRF